MLHRNFNRTITMPKKKIQMAYFVTVGFYNEYDEYETRMLKGYYSRDYAQAVCVRLMKYTVDMIRWKDNCESYLDTHPELLEIPMKDNQYPQTRRKLRAEWESANPLATTAKQHGRSYFITEAPIKTI